MCHHVCMCMPVFVYVLTCMHACAYVRVCLLVCRCVFLCVCVCVCVNVSVSTVPEAEVPSQWRAAAADCKLLWGLASETWMKSQTGHVTGGVFLLESILGVPCAEGTGWDLPGKGEE